jgi:hypothetical protein
MHECSRSSGCTIPYRLTPHLYTCHASCGARADEVEQELLELVRALRVYCQIEASVRITRGHADDGPQCPASSVSSRMFEESCSAIGRVFRLRRLRAAARVSQHAPLPATRRYVLALIAFDEQRRAFPCALTGRKRECADVADACAEDTEREPSAVLSRFASSHASTAGSCATRH